MIQLNLYHLYHVALLNVISGKCARTWISPKELEDSTVNNMQWYFCSLMLINPACFTVFENFVV